MELKKRVKLFNKYFKKRIGKPNDDIIQLIQADYEGIIERAKKLLRIQDEDIVGGPITVIIPEPFYENSKIRFRYDADKKNAKVYYNQALSTVLFFGKKTLYFHQVNIFHPTGELAFDVAGQVDYFDIVNIKTYTTYDESVNPNVSKLIVDLGISDGSVIKLKLRHHFLHEYYEMPDIITNEEARVLDALTSVIKQAK